MNTIDSGRSGTARAAILAVLTAVLLGACNQTTPLPEPGTRSDIATGLNGPMGVTVASDGTVWAIDSGTGGPNVIDPEAGITWGSTSRIVRVAPDGTQSDVATLPSIGFPDGGASGGSRVVLLDGELYATSAEWEGPAGSEPPFFVGVVKLEGGEVVEVADTWAVEVAQNPDGVPLLHAHPYGLTVGPDDALWIAEAGANALLRVDPDSGATELITAFAPRMIPTPDGGTEAAEPVPTGVATGADGNLYVSFFHGGVDRVTPEGVVSSFAAEPLFLTDLETGPDGNLYAVQIFEMGAAGPLPGRILRFNADGTAETVLDDLDSPSSIAFDADGNAYITVGVFGPSGKVIEVARLTELEPVAN